MTKHRPPWYITSHLHYSPIVRLKPSASHGAMAVLRGKEGNRRSNVTLAMRHRHLGMFNYGLNGLTDGTHFLH